MQMEIIEKEAFCVIGKEGSTDMGAGFVGALWNEANSHFHEVAPLAKTDASGAPVGCWGAMSRFAMDFLPWEENFSKGKYLAGIECSADAVPPAGWVKWEIPGFRFLRILCESENPFELGLQTLAAQGYSLAGAVQDFTDVKTGKNYMCFPIERK